MILVQRVLDNVAVAVESNSRNLRDVHPTFNRKHAPESELAFEL